MEYVILGIGLIIILIAFSYFARINKRKKTIGEIRDQWGKEKKGYINFDRIQLYSDTIHENTFHKISDQTISDIDFYDLFAFIDRTTSKVGQQYLFNLLKKPSGSVDELLKLNKQVNFWRNNVNLREKIQQDLIKLNSNNSYSIPLLMRDKLVERPKWYKWLLADITLLLGFLLLSLKFPALILVAFLIAGFNVIFLNYLTKGYILQFTNSLQQLNKLINVTKKVSKNDIPFEREEIEKGISVFKKFQQRINILYFGYDEKNTADINSLPVYIFELFKSLFLVEAFTLFNVIKLLENNQPYVRHLFKYIGGIDISISIASLREGALSTCEPNFADADKVFSVKNIIHPLVEDCVSNSIHIKNKSILITGSNMSGKTTFLRTLAINALLAQTIYTCFADEYSAPVIKLHSSIRIDDNLFEGKSYFLQEVNVMGTLINESVNGDRNMFILDEVFKGTNTIERIAAAKAILSYLNYGQNIVFVSTHDIELSNILANEYDLYHFTETIENSKLLFDHKLKYGPVKTKNAIKILELSNYPKEIINEAVSLSTALSVVSIQGGFASKVN